jgi:hypothetical protein
MTREQRISDNRFLERAHPREFQQCGSPVRSDEASLPSPRDSGAPDFEALRTNLDNLFAQLTQHVLAPNIASFHTNAIAASNGATEASHLTRIPSSNRSGLDGNERDTAGNSPSKTVVRHGYWGYWSWSKS